MRRTMFVVPVDDVPLVQAAVTDALVPAERKRTIQMVEGAGVAANGARWLQKAEAATAAALESGGEATGAELSKAVPALREQIAFGEGKKWAGTVGMSTRVLFLLSCEQRVVRGRPKGSWISSQYRWAPMSAWIPDGIPTMAADDAAAELVRRWLAVFGPGTVADLRWWTGWTLGKVRKALERLDVVDVDLDGAPGIALGGDDAPVRPRGRGGAPWVALLPALDPTTMGWAERGWYLGDHKAALFDRNGNAGPTVWCDGRIVGGWAQRKSGEVVVRVLEDVGGEATKAVEREAAELEAWIGDVRVTPRFPTPLQKELTQ
jgi:hypothetical protein